MDISEFDEIEDFFNKLLAKKLSFSDFRNQVMQFEKLGRPKQVEAIADLLNKHLENNGAVFIHDEAGLLQENGSLSQYIADIIPLLNSSPHPPVIFIARRNMPTRFRQDCLIYVSVRELTYEDAKKLLSLLLKAERCAPSSDSLDKFVELTRRFPLYIYRLVEEIKAYGADAVDSISFLKSQRETQRPFYDLYKFDSNEIKIVVVLKTIPGLDADGIREAAGIDREEVSASLRKLMDRYFIYLSDDIYKISFVWRDIIKRDKRIKVAPAEFSNMMRKIVTK